MKHVGGVLRSFNVITKFLYFRQAYKKMTNINCSCKPCNNYVHKVTFDISEWNDIQPFTVYDAPQNYRKMRVKIIQCTVFALLYK